MRFASTAAVILFTSVFLGVVNSTQAVDALIPGPVTSKLGASCGCNDLQGLTARLKGVEAVLVELSNQQRGPTARTTFDANVFDSGLGETITRTLATSGGISSMVIADIDRSSCEVSTGPDLSGIPGAPAGIGGSACLKDGAAAGLSIRRQACLAGRNSSNEGNDYWEGRQMTAVHQELVDAYTAEANFLKQQIARLAATCGAGSTRPVAAPPKNICRSCVQYLFEGERTLPVVGTIRMTSNEVINFSIGADNKISGTDSITTVLDTSGSPCTISGFNGLAEINVAGEIQGGYVNAIITPKGSSQRTSAHMKITCPPEGNAEVFPVQQDYELHESLKIPARGQRYTEKRIDLAQRTLGAMRGYIILRLFMTPQ